MDFGGEDFEAGGEFGDEVGILGGHVVAFGGVAVDVEEFRRGLFALAVFPGALADGFEDFAEVVKVFLARRGMAVAEVGEEAFAVVDAVFRKRDLGGVEDGGEEVEGGGEILGDLAGADGAGPADDAGDTGTAFVARTLRAAEDASGAGMPGFDAFGEHTGREIVPRSVVAGENNHGVLIKAFFLQGTEDFSDGPIEGFDDVTVMAGAGAALPILRDTDREVGHGVGDVEEEGAGFKRFYKLDGFVGVAGGEVGLVGDAFNHVCVAIEVEGAVGFDPGGDHVVGVGEAEPGVEAAGGGEVAGSRQARSVRLPMITPTSGVGGDNELMDQSSP